MAGDNSIEEIRAIAHNIKMNNERIAFHEKRADAIVKGMLQHSRKDVGVRVATDINSLCDEYLQLSFHGLRAKGCGTGLGLSLSYDIVK